MNPRTPSIEVRTATLHDLPKIMDIEHHSYPIDMQADVGKMVERLEVFPEGNFLVLSDGETVGYATNQIMHFHPSAASKNWIRCTNGGYSGVTHNPDGNALYFISTGVHLSHRRTGLGRVIYDKRLELAMGLGLDFAFANFRVPTLRENLEGACGVTEKEFFQLSDDEIRALGEEYLNRIEQGEIKDPLCIMFERGFELGAVIPWYMQDIESMHMGAYMFKELKK